MSQAEELLESVSKDVSVALVDPTTEPHIVIGDDRYITVPAELQRIAVQYDNDIETVTFDCPRYWDGHDMSKMAVYINYKTPGNTKESYPARNVRVDDTDDNIMHFDWTVSINATRYKGNLAFLVCIKSVDEDGNEVNHWNSELNRDMYISEGLECTESFQQSYPDLYTELLYQIADNETIMQTLKAETIQETTEIKNEATNQANTSKSWAEASATSAEEARQLVIEAVEPQLFASEVEGMNPLAVNSADAPIIYTRVNGITEQAESPTPDNPQDIYGLGESVNLFDGTLLDGYYNNDTDSSVYDDGDSVYKSLMLSLPAGTYTISFSKPVNIIRLLIVNTVTGEINRTHITDVVGVVDYTFTIDPNCETGLSFRDAMSTTAVWDDSTLIQVEKGSVSTKYKPYGQNCFEIRHIGKNLLGGMGLVQALLNSGSINITVDEEAGTISHRHNSNWNDIRRNRLYDTFKENTQYTLVLKGMCTAWNADNTLWPTNISIKYTDGTTQSSINWSSGNSIIETLVVNSYADKTIDYIMFGYADNDLTTLYYNECGLFEGVITADELGVKFKPYEETTVNIPLDAPLYSGDYIEYRADSTGKLVKNTANIVFDGGSDELWYYESDYFYTPIADAKGMKYSVVHSTHFVYDTTLSEGVCKFGATNNNLIFYPPASLGIPATDVAAWKAWLAENPVTVVYELAEPIETELTAEQIEEFEKLRTFDDATQVLCDGETDLWYYEDTYNGRAMAWLHEKIDAELDKMYAELTNTATDEDIDAIIAGTYTE